ncbi:MAG: replicative DNA helicase, partial [Ruminococcus sp.]|nr:replicative DNA helicase [Ruminococcus sp.]
MPDNNTNLYSGMRLPYSPDAEQAVLGAILLDEDALARAAEILPSADYFYIATHRTIYSTMLRMFTEGRPVDMVTLVEELKRQPDYDDATTKTYLVQMAQSCPAISNLENYC